jgi:dTDP-4-amino-4,6-dideoxygalactose transaminase
MNKIPYINLAAQWENERDSLLPIIEGVLASGQYIGGRYIEDLEEKTAKLCQTKHSIALNSGTDALIFGLAALGVKAGDEVITPPNSFIASTAAIIHVGAKPIFIDVMPDQNIDPEKIERCITQRTKAIMPVHLTGRMAGMDRVKQIADQNGIPIIEDAAQSIGSKYQNIPSGKWGKVGCFSAHPLKNLNACGDGGFVVTDDDSIAANVRLMRNHGLVDRNTAVCFGKVSRMDVLQAAILCYRMTKLSDVIAKRRKNAALYRKLLDPSKVFIPDDQPQEFNTYHTFVVQIDHRDQVSKRLLGAGIETAIHYPIPIHLQPASKKLGYPIGSFPITERQANRILTLPIHQYLSEDDIVKIATQLNRFCVAA